MSRVSSSYPISRTPYAYAAKGAAKPDPKVSVPKKQEEAAGPAYIINLMGEPVVVQTANGFYGPLPADGKAIARCLPTGFDNETGAALRKIVRSHTTVQHCKWQTSVMVDEKPQKFPQPRKGVLLLIPEMVALIALEYGREIRDLVFPLITSRREDGTLVCQQFGTLEK